MRLIDLTYKDFFDLSEEEQERYTFALSYAANLTRSLDTTPFMSQPFGFVKNAQAATLSWETFLELLAEVRGCEVKELVNLSIFALRAEMLYFGEQVNKINEAEKALTHKPTGEEMAAGADTLTNFGALPQFLELAKGDITKVEAVKALPYSLCFAYLLRNKELHEYEKRLNKIRTSK